MAAEPYQSGEEDQIDQHAGDTQRMTALEDVQTTAALGLTMKGAANHEVLCYYQEMNSVRHEYLLR
jgi:hypothetical protein